MNKNFSMKHLQFEKMCPCVNLCAVLAFSGDVREQEC